MLSIYLFSNYRSLFLLTKGLYSLLTKVYLPSSRYWILFSVFWGNGLYYFLSDMLNGDTSLSLVSEESINLHVFGELNACFNCFCEKAPNSCLSSSLLIFVCRIFVDLVSCFEEPLVLSKFVHLGLYFFIIFLDSCCCVNTMLF